MPVTLPAISRRHWIKGGLAALLSPQWAAALDKPAESETWVLFADTHVPADPLTKAHGTVMAENLTRCVDEVLNLAAKPGSVLVNGDCAHLVGKAGDYATFIRLIQPLREAGIPVHCTLGNHDHHGNFAAVLPVAGQTAPVEGKHVGLIPGTNMNWILLDSLEVTNKVTGLLGEPQLGWLERTLSGLPDKPTVVMAHHNPHPPAPGANQKITGLMDSEPMFEILARHKKVKAYVFGHTHNWSHSRHAATGLHLVNLPPTAYVFRPARPNGWVTARANREQIEFELHALDPAHEEHGQKIVIPWDA